jgi:hypothetical protein
MVAFVWLFEGEGGGGGEDIHVDMIVEDRLAINQTMRLLAARRV